jgi:hypothetical protein
MSCLDASMLDTVNLEIFGPQTTEPYNSLNLILMTINKTTKKKNEHFLQIFHRTNVSQHNNEGTTQKLYLVGK